YFVVSSQVWIVCFVFFFSSRRRHTRSKRDWSSDVCSSDLDLVLEVEQQIGDGVVRCIAMGVTDGLPRGVEAENTGAAISVPVGRSEERRVGKECRCRWSREHENKNEKERAMKAAHTQTIVQ